MSYNSEVCDWLAASFPKGGSSMTPPYKPPIEARPIGSGRGYWNYRRFRFVHCTGSELVLGPSWQSRASALICIAFGIGLLILAIGMYTTAGNKPEGQGSWPNARMIFGPVYRGVAGILLVLLGLIINSPTVVFDKAAGTIWRRWLFHTKHIRSLRDVAAIQLLDVGWVTIRSGRGGTTQVRPFQVNLVLQCPPGARLNVCTEPDEAFSRSIACELAAFLDLPLVEQQAEQLPPQSTP
jgi:hypothetical protein